MIADDRGVALQLERREEPKTRVPESTLRRCVVALVDNAIGHSPADATVTVTLEPAKERSFFALSVRDQGGGIVGIDPRRVFERFARGDGAARGAGRSGFGIGLALVRDLADRYGGRIEVSETSAAGTVFTLTLPHA
jgi:signal transduction histidine kinase